jgi:hypothetical protein
MMRNATPEPIYRPSSICHYYYRLLCLEVNISAFVRYLVTSYRNNLRKTPAQYTFDFNVGVRGKTTCSSGVQYSIASAC